MKNSLPVIFFLSVVFSFSQTLKGVVLDAKTQEPIESAAIYFDNTTIGTSTNDKGKFEIEYNREIRSPLIISFLGYEKVTLTSYSPDKFYKVLLEEQNDVLDEVVIVADDGMSRALKLKYFKSEFLGSSQNGKSCTILNEEDLILRYNRKTRQLTASSRKPLMIMNDNLNYRVQFDIKDFVLTFGYANLKTEEFDVNALIYTGTSFFESIDDRKATIKKRNRTYKGSILHFMRSLAKQELEEEDYVVFSKGFKVDSEKYISVKPIKTSDSVEVKLRLPLSVLYKKKHKSELKTRRFTPIKKKVEIRSNNSRQIQDTIRVEVSKSKTVKNTAKPYFNTSIIIDGFGNYSPIDAMYFSGYMSQMRIGDTLPLDYEFLEDPK